MFAMHLPGGLGGAMSGKEDKSCACQWVGLTLR